MERRNGSVPITAESLLNDVLQRYPTTGHIFLEHGYMYRVRDDQIFLDFSPMTVGEYAELNGVEVKLLLGLVNAAAEAEEFAAKVHKSPS